MTDIATIKIIRSYRKTITMQVLLDGSVEVQAPFIMPTPFINAFIRKNSAWIEKRTSLIQKKAALKKTYVDGESYEFLGNTYALHIGNYTNIKIVDKTLQFPQALVFRIQKEIENWYIQQAKEIITAEVVRHAKEMQTSFTSITFSDTRSQWGRCTVDNRLQFSWRLVMAPFLVLRYVVVHELAHTTEKNHSRNFWKRVAQINPSYRQQLKWLKNQGNTLTV